jgi:NTE family protein
VVLILGGLITMHAQKPEDPKVGLVLSGGGAKGFAHIGVLKVIDSLGINIDYIAGTSMGAIIGSLYASGYSGRQLEVLFENQDFDELINDKFKRSSMSFFERESAEKYAVVLPFDKFSITLPSALSRGQKVYNLLYQLMLPVNDIHKFSELPIPFFCMATNIETGASVLMEEGVLAEAVTASGALPSLFQPVVVDGQILVDGGVTNNFPVELLRDKGMDIIIGVDVQDALRDRESLKSAIEILAQINNFRTINAMKDKAPLTDIYIKPDITDFSVISFDEGQNIIANGESAARIKLQDLINIKQKQQKPYNRPVTIPPDSLRINEIQLEGNERYTRSYLKGKLKLRGGENISYQKFRDGINNLIATDNFDTFRYRLEPNASNEGYTLTGEIRETEATMF